MRSISLLALLALLAACDSSGQSNPDNQILTGSDEPTQIVSCEAGSQTPLFETSDRVMLEADRHSTGANASPAVVLLHMIPPANDPTNYPQSLIDALLQHGLSVLNIDRRSAGNSGGVAREAYSGPKGKLEVQAAVDRLASHPCAIDTSAIGLAGASNGSTSVLDYRVDAVADGYANPSAIVFLTGGSYTEGQNNLDAQREKLGSTAVNFSTSTAERQWNVGFLLGEANWVLIEYPSSGHGTSQLSNNSSSIDDVANSLARHLN